MPEDVGRFLEEMFASERTQLNALLSEELRDANFGGPLRGTKTP